jgi:hypothetical protein
LRKIDIDLFNIISREDFMDFQGNSLTELQDWLENKIEELEQGTDDDVYQNSCCIQTEIHTLKEVLGKINKMEG